MTEKQFFNYVTNAEKDVLQLFFNLLNEHRIPHCVIEGLAVNAYTEPVVSLDLDIVVAANKIEQLTQAASKLFKIENYEHSINLTHLNRNFAFNFKPILDIRLLSKKHNKET